MANRHKNGATGRRRMNGTGTIVKSGGRWRIMYWVEIDGVKKRKSETIDATSRDEARETLRERTEGNALITREKEIRRRLDALKGVEVERRKWEAAQPAMSFDEAWEAFDGDGESKRRDPATHRNYCQWYGIFTRWMAANHPEVTELRRVDSVMADEYSKHLLGTVRATTHNRHLNALALIWATLAACGVDGRAKYPAARLGPNPFAWDKRTRTGIQRVKLCKADRPHRRRDLTLEELARILAAARGEVRLLIGFGFYTGLRLGDCALMDWGSIDRVNGIITTRSRKTDTPTETKVHPRLAAMIAETCGTSTGYLMPELAALYNGGTNGRVKLSHMIADVFAAAGIKTSYKAEGETRARPDCGFHSLRHTYVTQLERVGATLAERQRLAGHRTAAMAEHYTHGDQGRVLALPDIMADAQGAENALPALPAATGTSAPTDGADAAEGRYSAFRAAWDALATDEERDRARAYIERRQN